MNQISKGKKYNRIKAELAEAGKQNADLATHMQVHASTVSDCCTNTNQPSIQDLFRIAEFLQIDVRKLLMPTSWVSQEVTTTQAAEKEPAPIHKLKSHKPSGAKSKAKPKNQK
ncbi:MAG: helix-turn-helix transcriptional regulator [Bacteroidetes bacterium]|nr:helix-turn-helix transcriptional regulator [Bacteroidota bacterium]